jgi:hypothetical protein
MQPNLFLCYGYRQFVCIPALTKDLADKASQFLGDIPHFEKIK